MRNSSFSYSNRNFNPSWSHDPRSLRARYKPSGVSNHRSSLRSHKMHFFFQMNVFLSDSSEMAVCQWGWCTVPGARCSVESDSKDGTAAGAFICIQIWCLRGHFWFSDCEHFSFRVVLLFFLAALSSACLFIVRAKGGGSGVKKTDNGAIQQQISTNDVSCHCAVSMPRLCAWWIE